FAGTRPAGELIEDEQLGWACEYDVDQVAEAMIAALRTPPTEAERDRLAQWTQQHRSLDAAAARGAEAIRKVRQTTPRARGRREATADPDDAGPTPAQHAGTTSSPTP